MLEWDFKIYLENKQNFDVIKSNLAQRNKH